MKTDTSCWTCGFRWNRATTAFGVCTYFETLGKEAKLIPCSVVDVGCKFWKVRAVTT